MLLIILFICIYNIDKPILITKNKIANYNDKLKKFEKKMSNFYKLNEKEYFRLDHGLIYSKFFDRMGKLYMNICFNNKKEIIATGSGILRNINNEKIWYICDLKIDKQYRGKWIPFKMLMNSLHLSKYSKKAYGITMNEPSNKVLKLAKNIKTSFGQFQSAGNLLIYLVDSKIMHIANEIISKHKGPLFYISLRGIKDIILKSTDKPIELYHVNLFKNRNNAQYENYQIYHDIIDNGISKYMFCFHENDPINDILKNNNITTDITANILQHNMDLKPTEWDFIQTSEI